MTEQSKTPRTDAVKFTALGLNCAHLQDVVQLDFARKLELDHDALKLALQRMKEDWKEYGLIKFDTMYQVDAALKLR